jgi:hypothetical protein
MLVFEEKSKILRRKNVVDLATDGMDRVVGEHARGADNSTNRNCAAVGGDLPLIVADDAQLQ